MDCRGGFWAVGQRGLLCLRVQSETGGLSPGKAFFSRGSLGEAVFDSRVSRSWRRVCRGGFWGWRARRGFYSLSDALLRLPSLPADRLVRAFEEAVSRRASAPLRSREKVERRLVFFLRMGAVLLGDECRAALGCLRRQVCLALFQRRSSPEEQI